MSSPAENSAERTPTHPNFDRIYADAFAASNLQPDEHDTHNDWMLVDADVPEPTVNLDGEARFEPLARRTRVTYAIPKIIRLEGVLYDISEGNAIALNATVRNSTLGPRVQVEPNALVADSTIDQGARIKADVVVENGSYVGIGALLDTKVHADNARVGNHAILRKNVCAHDSTIGERAVVHQDAQVKNNSVVGESSKVGAYTKLSRAYLDKNVAVGVQVTIDSATIDQDARVDDSARISGAHVGEQAQILRYAVVECDVPDNGVAISDTTVHIVHADRVIDRDSMLGTFAARKGKRSNT